MLTAQEDRDEARRAMWYSGRMQTRRMVRLGLGAALVAATVAGAAKLDTSTLLGAWAGSWTSPFGTGTIVAGGAPQGTDAVLVSWNISGVLFGCPQPGTAVSGLLLKGSKENGYTTKSIIARGDDSTFGHVVIKNKGTKFSAKGRTPCNGVAAKSYKASATLTGATLVGTMKIVLNDKSKVNATFTATKQPA